MNKLAQPDRLSHQLIESDPAYVRRLIADGHAQTTPELETALQAAESSIRSGESH